MKNQNSNAGLATRPLGVLFPVKRSEGRLWLLLWVQNEDVKYLNRINVFNR